MKKKRNTLRSALSLLLACCLLAGLSLVTYAAPVQFSDVKEGDWYYDYACELSEAGVIAGYPDGTYRPDNTTTAGEALRLILSAAGWEDQVATDAHWASGYLSLALEEGILAEGEIADLEAPISRLLIAQAAARALGLAPSAAASPFVDTDDALLTAMYEAGILAGSFVAGGVRVFLPDDFLTRAEISSIIYHIFRYQQEQQQQEQPQPLPVGEEVLGVDVSAHNGSIDWQAVAADGIRFAMIRIGYRGYTEGNIYIDRLFRENIEGAQAAGLSVGVYFFSQAVSEQETVEEAEFVLAQLAGYEIDYPVVFDWEPITTAAARTDEVDTDTLCRCAQAFCETVERAGYRGMVYFYPHMSKDRYDLSRLTQFDFWYANYTELDDIGYPVHMWQYTSSGTVAGIDGKVDLNLCYQKY